MPILLPFSREKRAFRDILNKAIQTFGAQYQLLLLQGKAIETKDGVNTGALAFLMGFIREAAGARRLESVWGTEICLRVYKQLWGESTGERYFDCLVDATDHDDPEVKRGFDLGALYFRHASETGQQPLGWFECFD